ncbi:MAG TPA: methyltransferase domain-containing protein [Pseudomonas xinjiangensis]|uniref:tRNA 5-carboxymethoxyuridine methyltransferase n=2 Tax=root TaxID=1 RepID=A0A7V1BPI0_9GAMM|nr:methyltransferase domain-containing protein [Halopseudomonas xinjiangensis]HEC49430.1 methyltransferase domain-containing protein [Halopseudomonas xinjiangensis]
MTDRYFDQMGAHFARKIYASPKGAIRLAVLTRDLTEWLPEIAEPDQSLQILDVGAGLGHISEWLIDQGHRVTVCDPSSDMIEAARERLDSLPSAYPVEYLQAPLQDLPARGQTFDLVVCHAVLEWLADPEAAMVCLRRLVGPQGAISLAVYNRDALIYKNLIKGQFRKLKRNQLAGEGGRSLTPQQPLDPREALEWAEACGLSRHYQTGIRVFHDYMPEPFKSQAELADVLDQELLYSQHPAYRHLGRYLHWWLRPVSN